VNSSEPRVMSGFSTVGSKFVSIVRQARMVSTGDNGIRLVRASSVELPCSRARGVCSRGYKLVGRGCRTPSPLKRCSICRRSNPCNGCSPLPFIVTMGGAQGGSRKEVQCLSVF
jgi:hypothetical protein